jgi:uncharacterized DUF497 family protein
MEDNRMVSFSLGGMAFEYDDNKNQINIKKHGISFKSAAHIDPSAAATKVMAHEQEHVSNANRKAASKDGEVLNATVTLKTAVCPECGRSYVSGGVTNTAIKYPATSYGQNQKSADYPEFAGKNVDYAG